MQMQASESSISWEDYAVMVYKAEIARLFNSGSGLCLRTGSGSLLAVSLDTHAVSEMFSRALRSLPMKLRFK